MKEYIKPEIIIIEAETEVLMAASGLGYDAEGENVQSRSKRYGNFNYDDFDEEDELY